VKFDKKYPKAKYLHQYNGMLKGKDPRPCWNCKELTTWLEIDFCAYICSEECLIAKNKEYFESCVEAAVWK